MIKYILILISICFSVSSFAKENSADHDRLIDYSLIKSMHRFCDYSIKQRNSDLSRDLNIKEQLCNPLISEYIGLQRMSFIGVKDTYHKILQERVLKHRTNKQIEIKKLAKIIGDSWFRWGYWPDERLKEHKRGLLR